MSSAWATCPPITNTNNIQIWSILHSIKVTETWYSEISISLFRIHVYSFLNFILIKKYKRGLNVQELLTFHLAIPPYCYNIFCVLKRISFPYTSSFHSVAAVFVLQWNPCLRFLWGTVDLSTTVRNIWCYWLGINECKIQENFKSRNIKWGIHSTSVHEICTASICRFSTSKQKYIY
jgi:hypothetical protein